MTAARPKPKSPRPFDRVYAWYAAGPAFLFLLLGLPFLRKTGLHYDASSELACFYPCAVPEYRARMFGHDVPLMVLQYLGALKAELYLPILLWLQVTPFVLRLPFLVCGAASVCLFGAILDRVSGRRAAIIGALLLATDLSFLAATSYDFGPIVLLHLFFLAGMLLLLRFDESGRTRYLALAFFLFGLAFWEKALFVWMFTGLCAASAAAFPRRILARATPARAAIAAVSLVMGAFPLLYYNAVTGGATLHTGNVMSGPSPLAQKVLLVKKTLNGSVLSGWMTEDQQPQTRIAPIGILGKVSAGVTRITGSVGADWMVYLLFASFALLPWLWFTPSRSAALFGAIYLVVTWAQMAILPNTGATLHHVILLWPMPHFLIAVAIAQLWVRFGKWPRLALAGATAAAIVVNLLVMNSFYTELVTRGTSAVWTDAVYPLFADLESRSNTRVVTVDWGYSATLCLLSDGEMPIHDISFTLLNPSAADAAGIQSLMDDSQSIFVDRAGAGEQFPGVREHLAEIAGQGGYGKQIAGVIRDRNARPRFELFRYVKER